MERLLLQIGPAILDDELEDKLRRNETNDGIFLSQVNVSGFDT